MKIAQIVCVLPPNRGGIGQAAHQISNELVKRGNEVEVFLPYFSNLKRYPSKFREYKMRPLRPLFRFGHFAFMPQLFFKLRKFDVIHLHYPFFGTAILVRLYKFFRRKKVKLVLTYHMDVIGKGFSRRIFKWHGRWCLQHVIKQADKIIVSSIDYVINSDISDYYLERKHDFVEIPFGVTKDYLPEPKKLDLLAKYGFEQTDVILLFVGVLDRAHYFKGVNFLLDALGYLEPHVKVLIVGAGDMMTFYKETVKSKGLDQRVVFAGYVKDEHMPDHYNLADIFILPSVDKSEAFGIVLLEAMSCGKPLIASNLKGVRSVVNPGRTGLLVEPGNSFDIAEKVKFLLKHPELVEQIKRRSLETVDQFYRWPIVAKKTERVYKKLLGVQNEDLSCK